MQYKESKNRQYKKHSPFIIGVAGSTASGKTTICRQLKSKDAFGSANCLVMSCDNYYKDYSHLSKEEINQTNFDHPESIDFDLLTQHIQTLKNGFPIHMPQYNFKTHARMKPITVYPKPYIVLEGILVLHIEKLRHAFDYRIYIDMDPELAYQLRLARDIKERGLTEPQILTQYQKTVWPMFQKYVGPSRQFADLVIDNSNIRSKQEKPFDLKALVAKIRQVQNDGVSKNIEHYQFFSSNFVKSVSVEVPFKLTSKL